MLAYYRILVPFALKQTIEGTNLLVWLLESPNHSKRKYKLLTFLLTNCNIFVRLLGSQPYAFHSIADYACAKVALHLLHTNYEQGAI